MIKILLTFVLLTIAVAFGIRTVRQMTGKEKWALTKTVGYAILCSSIAFALMISIVIIF
jgi:hypothetical protein